MRIEIAGLIGSGKSSLANFLLENGFRVVFEEFKLNPFWKAFYSNPDKYNFETEITFLLQHYHDLKRKLEEDNIVVSDFSFTQDLAYAVLGLKQNKLKVFTSVYDHIIDELGPPHLIIYMKCSPRSALNRIQIRGREEEKLINEAFLANLNLEIENEIKIKRSESIEVFEINTEIINIINNSEDQRQILTEIRKKI